MGALLRVLASLRVSALAWSLPYAWLWSHSDHSGGVLMVIAHSLLLLCYLVSFTDAMVDAGQDPRLALIRDRAMYSRRATEIGRFALAALTLIVGVLLVLSQLWAGVTTLVALTLIMVMRGGLTRRRLELAELVLPAGLLIVPMMLVRSFSRSRSELDGSVIEGMSSSVLAATWLGAIMLAVYVLLCLLRDEAADRGLGLRTTVTLLGRTFATVFLFAWLALAVVMAMWGSTHAQWHWSVGAIVGIGGCAATWAVAARAEGYAVTLWWLAHGVVALILVCGVA